MGTPLRKLVGFCCTHKNRQLCRPRRPNNPHQTSHIKRTTPVLIRIHCQPRTNPLFLSWCMCSPPTSTSPNNHLPLLRTGSFLHWFTSMRDCPNGQPCHIYICVLPRWSDYPSIWLESGSARCIIAASTITPHVFISFVVYTFISFRFRCPGFGSIEILWPMISPSSLTNDSINRLSQSPNHFYLVTMSALKFITTGNIFGASMANYDSRTPFCTFWQNNLTAHREAQGNMVPPADARAAVYKGDAQ